MKKSYIGKSLVLGVLSLIALFGFAKQVKVLQIFSLGKVSQQIAVSDIDYIDVIDMPAPDDVQLTTQNGYITIKWNPVEGATSYTVYRSSDNAKFSQLTNTTETSYTDRTPLLGANYYRVKAIINGLEGGYVSTLDYTFTESDLFQNRDLALGWLEDIYTFYPDCTNRYADNTGMYWNGGSIEGYLPWDWVETHDIINGTLTSSTGFVQRMWQQYYIGISKCNAFLANINNSEALSSSEKATVHAEARALRALFYLNLVKLYGPVPLIGERVCATENSIDLGQLARNTVDECFDYIISEFKAVLNQNVLKSSFDAFGNHDYIVDGVFTQEVVDMLLCDAYLFRASYLFNGDQYYAQMSNQNGNKLFPQARDEQKWRDVKEQAAKIINAGKYSLVLRDIKGQKVSNFSEACPFKSVFYASMGTTYNEELIFGRTKASREGYSMVPRFSGLPSNYDKGGGALSIPLEFVDLYFTNKGLRIDEDPDYFTYDTDNPPTAVRGSSAIIQTSAYKDPISGYQYFAPVSAGGAVSYVGPTSIMKQFYDREARFYLAVTFQNRPWDFQGGAAVQMQFNGNSGSDGRTLDYPVFGTIVRKNYYHKESNFNMSCEYRLAEVYLDYAEACAELGEFAEALKYVNYIRSRAGIAQYGVNAGDTGLDIRQQTKVILPAYDKETVLKAIYRERLLELAYENKHYFDVRRWSVADGKWRNGAEMTDGWIYPAYHTGGEGGSMTGFNINNVGLTDANKNVNFYKRVKQQERVFTKQMSLFPIPQAELNRNKLCVQNAGW